MQYLVFLINSISVKAVKFATYGGLLILVAALIVLGIAMIMFGCSQTNKSSMCWNLDSKINSFSWGLAGITMLSLGCLFGYLGIWLLFLFARDMLGFSTGCKEIVLTLITIPLFITYAIYEHRNA